MTRVLAIFLLVAGCSVDPCAGKNATCIALEIRAGAGVPSTVNQIGVTMLSGFMYPDRELRRPEVEKPFSLPALVALLPPATFTGGAFSLQVDAYVGGTRIASTMSDSEVTDRAHLRLPLTLATIGAAVDGGTDGAIGPCDQVSQTGCKAAEKCTVDVADGTKSCVPDRTVAVGQECSPAGTPATPATDTCKKGLMCIADSETGQFSFCRQFCNAKADCTQGAVIAADNVPQCVLQLTNAPSVKLCTVACDPTTANPVAGTGCISGTACRVLITGANERTDCVGIRGIATEGAACDPVNANCEDGLTCFKSVCRKPCVIASPLCGGGRTCTAPFSGAKPFGFCCPGGAC